MKPKLPKLTALKRSKRSSGDLYLVRISDEVEDDVKEISIDKKISLRLFRKKGEVIAFRLKIKQGD